MSKKNDDFFKVKKPWSIVKDKLLGCYLKPYMQKILYTRKPIVYVDCFAGKGVFEDGQYGSPLIALNIIKDCLSKTKIENCPNIESYFIDLNYADDLQNNLKDFKNIKIISGEYEKNIQNILKNKKYSNVFLYLDPYGIKALNYNLFNYFATQSGFNSIELLINMNSFGFIREACRVLNVNFKSEDIFNDLIEYDSTYLSSNEKSKNELTEIAGGEYWIKIISDYKEGKIDTYEAEKRFSQEYCNQLGKSYRYVLNMPLRIKQGQRPKYRMIHATNHVSGCILMADNICGCWELMRDIQTCGQLSFFDENIENEIVDEMDIEIKLIDILKNSNSDMRLNSLLAEFYMKFGAICPSKQIKDILKRFEKEGKIKVFRNPELTLRNKKPTTFFSDDNGKKTKLRWIK